MILKAVIFDIDGVLLDSFEANLKFFQNLMIRAGYPPPTREEFQPMFYLPMLDVIKILTGSQSEKEIMRIFSMGQNREVEYPLDLLSMPEDSAETIQALSKNYLLGIATGRVGNSVYEVPKLAELKKYFSTVVSYEDTENHKPHPDPLLLAAQKLNVRSHECVYIGDVENDFKAARGAGMKFILYSNDLVEGVDAATTDFENIVSILKTL